MTTVLAYIYLRPSLLVVILMSDPMDLKTVRFKRASLGKRLLTKIASIRTNTCMCSGVPFQVKCIIETFPTKRTEIAFCIRMTFHVPIEKSLKAKCFCTHSTLKLGGI